MAIILRDNVSMVGQTQISIRQRGSLAGALVEPAKRAIPAISGVSVFDFDRTLTRHGSYTPFLVFAAIRLAPWRLLLAPLVGLLMVAYKFGLISRARLKQTMQGLMLGARVSRVTIDRIAEAFVDRLMSGGMHTAALELLASEQAAGRTVAIASASHHFYLDRVAARLGVRYVIATRSHWSDGELTARINGENCYGAVKAERIERFLHALGPRELLHVRLYSDDLSDLPAFALVDQPIAVNPTAALARHARAQGWTILDWRRAPQAKIVRHPLATPAASIN